MTDFQPVMLEQLRNEPGVEQAEVIDIGLEDLFKDFVKGRKGTP